MRLKGLHITDVKTLLFFLSEFIWIKSDDDLEVIPIGPSAFPSLKGILERVKVGW